MTNPPHRELVERLRDVMLAGTMSLSGNTLAVDFENREDADELYELLALSAIQPTDTVLAEGELLPCPFCGDVDFLHPEAACYVHCPSCGADGPVIDHGGETGEAEAITAWNTRATRILDDGRMRGEVIAAYKAGAMDVHNNWQEDRDPDFTEAAHDYASAALSGDR